MQPMTSQAEARRILESGLLTGKWSVNDFNPPGIREPVLPSLEFLAEHPQFMDRHFRDLEAFRRVHHRNV